jgi:P27 family predicted phage terminase small subunit
MGAAGSGADRKKCPEQARLAVLAAYCTAYALYFEALEMVNKHGAIIKSPNGYPQQSPYLSHLNRQAEVMMRTAAELGFTPASRRRIFSFDDRNALLIEAKPDDSMVFKL